MVVAAFKPCVAPPTASDAASLMLRSRSESWNLTLSPILSVARV